LATWLASQIYYIRVRGRSRTSVESRIRRAVVPRLPRRSSGARCAPPSLELHAGHNPLVALRATRPNRDGAADMAAEPRACVAMLRVRSSAPRAPRLDTALTAGWWSAAGARAPRRPYFSLRCATRPIPVRLGHEHALASVVSAWVSARTPRGPLRPRMDAGCLRAVAGGERESDSVRRRTSCVASARICYDFLRSARTSCAAPSCTRRHAHSLVIRSTRNRVPPDRAFLKKRAGGYRRRALRTCGTPAAGRHSTTRFWHGF
jgi:hypothetical protein